MIDYTCACSKKASAATENQTSRSSVGREVQDGLEVRWLENQVTLAYTFCTVSLILYTI